MVRLLRSYLLENRAQPDRGDTHPGQVAELGLQAGPGALSEVLGQVAFHQAQPHGRLELRLGVAAGHHLPQAFQGHGLGQTLGIGAAALGQVRQAHPAGTRAQQAARQPEQGGFARAVGPDQGRAFTGGQRKGNVLQLPAAVRPVKAGLFQFQHVSGLPFRSCPGRGDDP